jgi:hypothetical protein
VKRGKPLKRTGFKRLTYEEAKAKQLERIKTKAAKRKAGTTAYKKAAKSKPKKTKRKVKYPSFAGVKNSMRWTGYKGALWKIFSMYCRKRDFIKYGGKCVSCDRVIENWRYGDGGHYLSVSRGNELTCFDEQNVNLQCKKCNNPTMTPDSAIPYRRELMKRYGKTCPNRIENLANKYGGHMTEHEIKQKIVYYKSKFDELV